MKKSIFILLYLIFSVIATTAAQETAQEKQLRDSIFKVYRSITTTGDKVHFMRTSFYQNIDKKWATQFLDSILTLSVAQNDPTSELGIRRDLFQHAKFQADLPKMEYYFTELKTASYKHSFFTYYFQVWNDILQFYNVRGDTEHSRIQSLKMEEEAKKLDNPAGIAYAYMSLARSLAASNKGEEAISVFRKALESTAIKPLTRGLIHAEIVTVYQKIGQNEKAIKELHIQKEVLEKIITEDPTQAARFRDKLLELELAYCAAYNNLNDASNLLAHLNEAKKYYTADCFFANYIGYHAYWGAYYRLTEQWNDCFREFDIALAHFDHTQPLHEMIIRRMKGKALVEAGRYKDATLLYKDLATMGDSLNTSVVRYHQEALQANYEIREALFKKSTLEKQYNWIIVLFVLASVLVMLLMVLRARKGNKALLRAEHQTRKALETVDAANKMKDVFLHNITHQIREPLNVVVGFSSILATEKDLTAEELQEYSESVKQNAALLFQLIIDVLDLSRLESGMMKFTISECDAVQLCKDAKMAIEMRGHNMVHLAFETELEALIIQTDNERLLRMLLSVLSAPESNRNIKSVRYTLHSENNQLKISVENSPLLEQPEHIQRIKHDINRLFLEIFGGTYQFPLNHHKGNISITYPLNYTARE